MRGGLVSTVRPAKARVTYFWRDIQQNRTSAKMALPNGGDRICLFGGYRHFSINTLIVPSSIQGFLHDQLHSYRISAQAVLDAAYGQASLPNHPVPLKLLLPSPRNPPPLFVFPIAFRAAPVPAKVLDALIDDQLSGLKVTPGFTIFCHVLRGLVLKLGV